MSATLRLLPSTPQLLTKRYYETLDTAHPLGLGWNQVESVRGWLRASGFIRQVERSRVGEWELTNLGVLVAERDRNLSKAATWWLIHIRLASDPDATVYHYLFSEVAQRPFTRAEARGKIAACAGGELKPASIESDVQGILSSFESGRTRLASLGALVVDGEHWSRGAPEDLNLAMLAYALCIVRDRTDPAAPSMSLQAITASPVGLQRLFGLGVDAVRIPLRLLGEPLARYGYSFVETAGLDSVTLGTLDPLTVARQGYEGNMRDVITP